MEIRMLGSVEVRNGDRVLVARRPQQSAVLAALAVDAGRLVTTETLVDRVWGDRPPPQVRMSLSTHLTRIRRLLEQSSSIREDRVVRQPGGYLLKIAQEQVDLHLFQQLLKQAGGCRQSGDERAVLYRSALRLWRGEPLAGMTSRWAAGVREAWTSLFLNASAAWGQAEALAGNSSAVIGPLTVLVAENPLVECLTETLMRALCASGRTAEAFDRYARTRRHLADELGVGPGPELQSLYQEMLQRRALP